MTKFRATPKDVNRVAIDDMGREWVCRSVFDGMTVFFRRENETYHLFRNDGLIYYDGHFVRWKDEDPSEPSEPSLKEVYEDVMLRDIKIRTLMEAQKDAKIQLGELIEKQGAKNADHQTAS